MCIGSNTMRSRCCRQAASFRDHHFTRCESWQDNKAIATLTRQNVMLSSKTCHHQPYHSLRRASFICCSDYPAVCGWSTAMCWLSPGIAQCQPITGIACFALKPTIGAAWTWCRSSRPLGTKRYMIMHARIPTCKAGGGRKPVRTVQRGIAIAEPWELSSSVHGASQ